MIKICTNNSPWLFDFRSGSLFVRSCSSSSHNSYTTRASSTSSSASRSSFLLFFCCLKLSSQFVFLFLVSPVQNQFSPPDRVARDVSDRTLRGSEISVFHEGEWLLFVSRSVEAELEAFDRTCAKKHCDNFALSGIVMDIADKHAGDGRFKTHA